MGKTSAKVFDLKGEEVDKVSLPKIFKTPNRPDVIKRAVVAIQSHRFQPQGRDPMAGKKNTAESRGTGLGISRMPRLKARGQRAAFAPGTGTPVAGGLASWQALEFVRGLAGLNLVAMDVVEVSPPYDVSEVTALAAATVAHDWLCLLAAAKGATPARVGRL